MTMVSYPAAIPLASAAAVPSPSSKASRYSPVANRTMEDDHLVPPALDCAILTAPSTTVNHLCSARLRLMSSLPSVGIAWSLWCGQCGALRDGLGGSEGPSCSKKRSADGVVKDDEAYEHITDELERELHRTLASMAAEVNEQAVARTPPARKPQRRRKSPTCTMCGAKFRRPVPRPPPYPSARSVARTRRASSLATCIKAEPEPERTLSPAGTVDAAELFGEESTPASPVGEQSDNAETTPHAPNALSRTPSLAHINSSDPSTPTYPKPSNVPPPQSGGTTVPIQLATSPPPAKKRKTKKSGLAKLLAQNAQREKEKSGSGSWGLG